MLRILGIALAIVLCSCTGVASTPGTAQPGTGTTACSPTDKLVPQCGAWWGAFVDPAPYGGNNSAALAGFESHARRQLDIVHRFHAWRDNFPDAGETAAAKGGRILYLAWQTQDRWNDGSTGVKWADIVAGKYNDVIDSEAANLRQFGAKVFLDFDQEPEDRTYAGSDAEFAAAYRYVHDRVLAAGATNVIWVWTVTGWNGVYDRYGALYPGDAYVDWIGWDPYNYYTCPGHGDTWLTPQATFGTFYNWLEANGHGNKPFMLSEYGSIENAADPGAKGAWLAAVPQTLQTTYPNIKAAIYFNQDYPGCAVSIETSGNAQQGFAGAGSAPYVNQPHQ